MSALTDAARGNSEDARKLAKETYDEVLKVLKAKAEEAKKLGDNAKEDVNDTTDDGKSKDSNKKKN